jgi:hypothetical protein
VVKGSYRNMILLLPVVLPLAFYVVALCLSAWPDYTLHVRTSLDRLILVTAPFGLWFVFEELAASTVRTKSAQKVAPKRRTGALELYGD